MVIYSPRPPMPPADPWDRQQGIRPVEGFKIRCTWSPVNDDWAVVSASIELHDGLYSLAKPVEMKRTQHGINVSPELFCAAWVKKVIANGGVNIIGLHEQNPGHITHPDGSWTGQWWATVGSRLTVAVVRLDGDLQGQARLIPVE